MTKFQSANKKLKNLERKFVTLTEVVEEQFEDLAERIDALDSSKEMKNSYRIKGQSESDQLHLNRRLGEGEERLTKTEKEINTLNEENDRRITEMDDLKNEMQKLQDKVMNINVGGGDSNGGDEDEGSELNFEF